MLDYKHKHFSEGLPEHGRVLHRNAGSEQFRAGAGNELDHKFPDRLLSAEYIGKLICFQRSIGNVTQCNVVSCNIMGDLLK